MDIKKSLGETKDELIGKMTKIEDKLDESDRDRKLVLKEYNERQRETEGRLSFLEASSGVKRWQRR